LDQAKDGIPGKDLSVDKETITLPASAGNWPATLAAIQARGPRCDFCGGWTFRPFLLAVPLGLRQCQDCARGIIRVMGSRA
jgi:hypothetical protein